MYVARASWPSSNGKTYQSVYLRESYRDSNQVCKRNIANLTHCDPREIAAIELALQFKGNLAGLGSLDSIELSQGPSVGAVWAVVETARRLGIRAWTALDVIVEEGLHQLQPLCATEVKVKGGGGCLRIPTPAKAAAALLKALKISLPEALPHTETPVVTRKKLPPRRKPR